MISALDSRYAERLQDVSAFLGEENFVLWMSRWSIEYVSVTFGKILPHYKDEQELFERVRVYEKITKHQMTALLRVLKEDFPGVKFHWGLTSEDIMHNARWSQITQVLSVIQSEFGQVLRGLRNVCNERPFAGYLPDILAHTHGQPATPVDCYQYLMAKVQPTGFVFPNFRMGGSNGQLTAWKRLFPDLDASAVAKCWLQDVRTKFFINRMDHMYIDTPNDTVGLLQHGPSNQECLLSCIGSALRLRSLARALWDHCYRGILVLKTEEGQTGSSAMPHKVNPLDFEQAEGAFSNAYHILIGALEANCDSRGLRDLSNSIVNRNLPDAFAYLFLGCSSIVAGLRNAEYSPTKIREELAKHPECLSELVRYFRVSEKGESDEVVYKDLKDNPPSNFQAVAKELSETGFYTHIN